MSEISNSNVPDGNCDNVETSQPSTPRARPGNLLNTIRIAEDVPFHEQLTLLWQNTLFCRATVAFATSNYINAGLAFIWIRLFIQLWTMEKQISVVSFLAITGGGHRCGKFCLLRVVVEHNSTDTSEQVNAEHRMKHRLRVSKGLEGRSGRMSVRSNESFHGPTFQTETFWVARPLLKI